MCQQFSVASYISENNLSLEIGIKQSEQRVFFLRLGCLALVLQRQEQYDIHWPSSHSTWTPTPFFQSQSVSAAVYVPACIWSIEGTLLYLDEWLEGWNELFISITKGYRNLACSVTCMSWRTPFHCLSG
ncbi:hypothetical protein K443DRAFT_189073 [Laccaria amethystina LaAM-08-1]|uniref:Uncharacterized protein n=1 Tax=Laccaria amethystina LaAM-08-1 TaxID=1095629 RepID=A0A0C9X1W0_9AGAR|nr:hypothetical protein K443DRAFT_189073 [Laccaria amethystina LaAM-08-1]